MTVEIYSKPNCSLCDQAKAVLEAVLAEVRGDLQVEVIEVDITSDPALFERYRYDIPVVRVDGHKAFKHRVDPEKLRERLLRAGRP